MLQPMVYPLWLLPQQTKPILIPPWILRRSAPSRFEGTKNYEECLEECTPELAGDSESEDLCESDATDHEGTSDGEDEEKADEEQVERMLRTNGADKC